MMAKAETIYETAASPLQEALHSPLSVRFLRNQCPRRTKTCVFVLISRPMRIMRLLAYTKLMTLCVCTCMPDRVMGGTTCFYAHTEGTGAWRLLSCV